MLKILYHRVQKCGFFGVGDLVIDLFFLSARDDESCFFQKAEMMRDGGRAHIHNSGEIYNALLGVTKHPEDSQARRVRELLEKT